MEIRKWQKCIFLAAMTGFITGICSANLWMKDYILNIGIFNQYFLEQYSRIEIVYKDYLWYLFKSRAIPVMILSAAAGTRYRNLAVIVTSMWLGYCFGMVICAAIVKMGIKGVILILISLIPQGIFYMLAGVLLCRYMTGYPRVGWNFGKAIKLAVFMTLGIVSECYVNPVVIKMFLKTL